MSEQHQEPSLSTNPETAHHRFLLYRSRRNQRLSGWLTFIASLIVLVGGAFLLGVGIVAHIPLTPILFFFLGAMIVAGGAGTLAAIMDLTTGSKPVTMAEVQIQRQRSREALLRQAQGYLPFPYRHSAIILEIVISCFWGLMAFASFIAIPISPLGWLDILMGILLLLGCLACLGDALFTRPKEAKRLAEQSAEELARRFTMGEVTEGQTSEND